MGVNLTKYGRALHSKKKRKRTVLPTRKQAMYNRHKSIHNTSICPEGQKSINGICTDASGVGFNGNDYSGNIIKPIEAYTNPSEIDLSSAIQQLSELISHNAPHWLSQRSLPKSVLIAIIEVSSMDLYDSKNLHKWFDMIQRADQVGPDAGQAILDQILNETLEYQRIIESKIEESEHETRILGFLILLAIIGYIVWKNRDKLNI